MHGHAPESPPTIQSSGRYVEFGLIGLTLAAAGIHFAFAPVHFNEDRLHGAFFVITAWLQVVWALMLAVRPSRRVLMVGILQAQIVALWLVSRTSGIPIGKNTGREPFGFPDTACSILEVLIVVGCLLLVLKPGLLSRPVRAGSLLPGLVTMAVIGSMIAATASLTPALAGTHQHGNEASNSGAVASGGHTHGAALAASGTAVGTGAAGDTSHGTPAIVGETPCEKAGPPASPGQVATDSEGGHGHRGTVSQKVLDAPARVLLASQQEQARGVATRLPTVAAAEHAGYQKSTVYLPCIGAHYTNAAFVGRFDPSAPSELLFDGTTPDAKIVGLSYLVYNPGGPPVGFAGPNDVWHQHNTNGGLCLNADGLVVGAESVSQEQCRAAGGAKVVLTDIWMVHDWIVPGWECSWGVFSGECPELGGRVGGSAWDV